MRNVFLGACATLLAACASLDSDAWRIRHTHDADGTRALVGNYGGMFDRTPGGFRAEDGFSGDLPDVELVHVIDDPLRECLEGLVALSRRDRDDPRVLANTIGYVGWLAAHCRFQLTRERCALELAELGTRVGAFAPRALAPDTVLATSEELDRALDAAANGDADACATVAALPLDLAGTCRALARTTVLVTGSGADERAEGDAVANLHDELLRRTCELSLAALVADPSPTVQAAATSAWISWSDGRDAAPYEAAFRAPAAEVLAEAANGLARHGAPSAGSGAPDNPEAESSASDRATETYWMEKLVGIMGVGVDGRVNVAACRAMARLSGEPVDLHPDVWQDWWAAHLAATSIDPQPSPP